MPKASYFEVSRRPPYFLEALRFGSLLNLFSRINMNLFRAEVNPQFCNKGKKLHGSIFDNTRPTLYAKIVKVVPG